MENFGMKSPRLYFASLLTAGFICLCLPGFVTLSGLSALCTACWILAFLLFTGTFTQKKQILAGGAVFVTGYYLRFASMVGLQPILIAAFLLLGAAWYGVFELYSRVQRRFNNAFAAFAFPAIWFVLYIIATAVRLPTLVRVDIMFSDISTLLSTEHYITSFGLSGALLWIEALAAFGISRKRVCPIAAAAAGLAALFALGIYCLYPNISYDASVSVAYTTGPYSGDFINCVEPDYDTCLASMRTSAAAASEQGAEILVFSEQAFCVNSDNCDEFISECSRTAAEYGIHMLVGLDIVGGDGRQGTNRICWVDSEGNVPGSYDKTKLVPVFEGDYAPGNGDIQSHVIQVDGRDVKVSYIICYDSNFPNYVGGIPDDTDILFLPSWDWRAVTSTHTRLVKSVAAENRVSLLKSTYDGESPVIDPYGRVLYSTTTDEIGYETVTTVEIPVKSSAVYTYPKRDNYIHKIVAIEAFSVLICAMLLCGSLFITNEKTLRSRIYITLVGTTILALVCDGVSWSIDGCTRLSSATFITSYFALILPFIMTGQFMAYLTAFIRERKIMKAPLLHLYMIIAALMMAGTLVFSINGKLFSVVDGVYTEGPIYSVYLIFNALSMIFCWVYVFMGGVSLNRRDRVAVLLYVMVPGVDAVINIFLPTFSYAFPASAISLVIVYIMIQSERTEKLVLEGKISSHNATHDELTSLPNRRAFDTDVEAMSESYDMLGVIFADINALKYENDHFGHDAGDRKILRFAGIAGSYFRKENIYRVSGDEFVILVSGMTDEAFEKRAEELEEASLLDGIPIASEGSACGSARDAKQVVKQAEKRMYAKKDKFHADYPEMARS